MFISNFKSVDTIKYYTCNNVIGKYLTKRGIPLLSRVDNKMIFVKTNKLQEALDKMPFYLKIFAKAGDSNG